MKNKFIEMPEAGIPDCTKENTNNDESHEIDYVTEEGKLTLDLFFSEGSFYVIKCIRGEKQGMPEDMIFQHYEELSDFLDQFREGTLCDCSGRLYFFKTELLYEIRRITNKGEDYLSLKSYDMHQEIINTIWEKKDFTEPVGLYAGIKQIRDGLYSECKDDTIYANTPETHTAAENHEYKDNGHYYVGGKSHFHNASPLDKETGFMTESFLEHLFDGRTMIIKDCSANKFLVMGSYEQLSRLWEKSDHIEIKDKGGDLSICCFKDKEREYVARIITETGELYLDSHKPCPELLCTVWEKNHYSEKVYKN